MRNVALGVGISLDGYLALPDGSVDFLFSPRDYSMASFFASVDTGIMGRKTLEAGLKMGGGSLGNWSMPMYVFSRSQPIGERNGVIFINDSPVSFIEQLRKRPGKDIWHMGGGELVRAFLEADLIDKLHLGVVPILLGEGIPLFPSGFPRRDFKLIENKTYSKGLISLIYERTRPKRRPKAL